ncbi:hypothetical protein [Methylobacterium sp. R2-1]|uniref:hypothetical protein n=1 Tax=Methylobacterium sp. R2-1 TaxID=2587064 RepID=UPI0016072FD9|nr:hypothetical protein [Methylobacterium sp. R2-1]MBB2964750.1 hypothetical protein [Methylobacterium sp. R2-1]
MGAKPVRIDPHAEMMARRLMTGAMDEVAQGILSGRDGYAVRESVLSELVPAWVKMAGRGPADAAVRGMYALKPRECLTAAEAAGLRRLEKIEAENLRKRMKRETEEYRAYLAKHAPHRLPQRPSMAARIANWSVLALLLAAIACGVLIRPAAAGEAHSRWRALAACGVAKGADYERKCRRFSRTERSTWRAYDGPGAGAPREWETPKAWESTWM